MKDLNIFLIIAYYMGGSDLLLHFLLMLYKYRQMTVIYSSLNPRSASAVFMQYYLRVFRTFMLITSQVVYLFTHKKYNILK